jgi:hypothetical protein
MKNYNPVDQNKMTRPSSIYLYIYIYIYLYKFERNREGRLASNANI